MSFLPPDHPHAQQQRVLGEIESNHNTAQPRRPATGDERPKALHKRTKSAISLKSLSGKSKDEKTKTSTKSITKRREGEQTPKKTKSTTSLTSMFKSKQPKDLETDASCSDKENSTPPKRQVPPTAHTPMYAALATQHHEISSTSKVPLNDRDKRQSIIEQIALYDPDPKRLDESKQRNFRGFDPRLSKPIRPKSEVISAHDLGRFVDNPLVRKMSNERRPMSYIDGGASQRPISREGEIVGKKRDVKADTSSGASRVKDAVARINRRTIKSRDDPAMDPKQFAEDFEAMLEARNIPNLVRQQMRDLDQHVKQALLKSYEQDLEASRGYSSGSNRSFVSEPTHPAIVPLEQISTQAGATSKKASLSKKEEEGAKSDSKKSRPRSRTFTFRRSDKSEPTASTTSPAKKQKTDLSVDMKRASQGDLSTPMMSAASPATPSGSYFLGLAKKNVPEDYVKYLQKHRKPEEAEVGKLHKLRQLLRNETVAWVHKFIELGGMTELVDLLHRLMEMEWR